MTAAEGATADSASFTFTRTGQPLNASLTVKFGLDGSATPTTDYYLYNANGQTISLSQDSVTGKWSGYLLIPANQASTTIELRPRNDAIREASETATLHIVANPSCFYNAGELASATASLADNDAWVYSVATLDGGGAETANNDDPLVFRVARSGSDDLTNPGTFWFQLAGTATTADYTLSGAYYNSSLGCYYATIPASQSYVDITFNVTNDSQMECLETVGITLVPKPSDAGDYYSDYALGADFSATGAIVDNDAWVLTVNASDDSGAETRSSEPSDPVAFTVTRSEEEDVSQTTRVYYRLAGVSSSDYTLSTGAYDGSYDYGYLNIPSGATSATVTLSPVNDALREGSETVVLTLLSELPANLTSPPVVSYTLGTTASASATIADNDDWTVSVSVADVIGSESSNVADGVSYVISRSGATDLDHPTTVYFELGGTATSSDYLPSCSFSAPYGYVVIPAGSTSTTLQLNVVDDSLVEDRETAVLTVLDSVPAAWSYYSAGIQYAVGASSTATAYLDDNEARAVVSIKAFDPFATETPSGSPSDVGTFRIYREDETTAAVTVYYQLSGTAVAGSDYASLTGTAVIPQGASYVDVTATPLDDDAEEGIESIVATIYIPEYYYVYSNELPYVLGTSNSAAVYLVDNEVDASGGPYVTPEGGSTTLTGFSELVGVGAEINWDLDGDGVYETPGAEVVYSASGVTATAPETSYPVAVKATLETSDYVVTTSVTVENVAPIIELEPATTLADNRVRVRGGFSDPGADVWSGTVDHGDGTTSPLTLRDGNRFYNFHTYQAPGWYDIVVALSDGKELGFARQRVQYGSPAALEITLDDEPTPLEPGVSTIAFQALNQNVAPAQGESVYRRLHLVNRGVAPLTFDVAALSLPSNVELVDEFPTTLESDEEAIVTLRWIARSALSGTLSIPTSDPVVPLCQFAVSGAVQSYVAPTISNVRLLHDTRATDPDGATVDPVVTGEVSGNFARGRVAVEFDLDGDYAADGISTVYTSGGSFEFDPRTTSVWTAPTSTPLTVAVKYRLVHYSDQEVVLSTGAWSDFSYKVKAEPSRYRISAFRRGFRAAGRARTASRSPA